MSKKLLLYAFSLLFLIALFSCRSEEWKYKQLEKKELSKSERYDSLFMGIYFGMSNQDFRDYCFQKNLEGKYRQGGKKSLVWVECKLENELDYPAAINFFPEFEEDIIVGMNAAIYYDNATFNDGVFETDSLLLDVLSLTDKWYGEGYHKIKSPFFYKEDVYVKIKGNRRITIYPDISGQMINLWFVDMKSK